MFQVSTACSLLVSTTFIAGVVVFLFFPGIFNKSSKDEAGELEEQVSRPVAVESRHGNGNGNGNGGLPQNGIIGPNVPQEITFLVNTPPAEHVPMHIGRKHKSIKRQLVVKPYHRTWERRIPVMQEHFKKSKAKEWTGGASPDKAVAVNADMKMEFIEDKKGVLPITSLVNVSAQVPYKCATVTVTIDTSVIGESSVAKELSTNVATLENWKSHHKYTHKDSNTSTTTENDEDINDESFCETSNSLGMEVNESSLSNKIPKTSKHGNEHGNGNVDDDGPNGGRKKKAHSSIILEEYTFANEFETGAFQTLHLALNTVGPQISDMYSALEMIHKQSDLDDTNDANIYKPFDECTDTEVGCPYTGVALDDVQRCLGDLPFISKRIVRIYDQCKADALAEQSKKIPDSLIVSAAAESKTDVEVKQFAGHQKNRIILGYIDFMRLFVPTVLHGTPYDSPMVAESHDYDGLDIHQARIRQLLKIRQRVASAAVNVQAYTSAMEIANKGWKIPTVNDVCHLRKSICFDYEFLNTDHDSSSQNEFYSPTPPRRESDSLSTTNVDGLPWHPQRAYALVGSKVITIDNENCPIHFSRDPVAAIPSLYSIIEKNPDNDFFVVSLFYPRQRAMFVSLFIKCIPDDSDADFDDALESFSEASPKIRDKMLELSMQIGPLVFPSYQYFWWRWHNRGTSMQQSSLSRIPLPSIKIAQSNRMHHFGGNEATETNFQNYLAVNCSTNSHKIANYSESVLQSLIPTKGISPSIVDFTFNLNETSRSMASIRTVHIGNSSRIPWQEMIKNTKEDETYNVIDQVPSYQADNIGLCIIDDDYKEDIESLKDILSCITVPTRETGDHQSIAGMSTASGTSRLELQDAQVLDFFDDHDIQRHLIAADQNLKAAAIRLTRCGAWRGLTLPIDTRMCKIELQSGQFFQQGNDLNGNPVFYFLNMCRGLWRKDVDASTFAVLHRLENAFAAAAKLNRDFKCTIVVLMGEPFKVGNDTSIVASSAESESHTDADRKSTAVGDSDETSTITGLSTVQENEASKQSLQEYYVHTNFKFVQRLIGILSQNYPERLEMALVVPNGGWEKFVGMHGLRRYLPSSKTRSKVQVLENMSRLKQFIASEQLVDIAGGECPVLPNAFKTKQ